MAQNSDYKEVSIRDYIDLLFRRKWIIIISFIVVFSMSMYHNFTQLPVYESVATFIIENNDAAIPMLNGLKVKESSRPFEFYQAIFNSRIFEKRVVESLITRAADDLETKLSASYAWRLIGKNLTISNPEFSDFVELRAKANDPDIAYLLAQISSEILKARCIEIDQEESKNIVTFVENQKGKAQQDLERVERVLQEFKEKTNSLVAGENGGLLKQLVEMESELLTIQTQRELAETNLRDYENRLKQMEIQYDVSKGRGESPEIQALRAEINEFEDLRNRLTQLTGKNEENNALDKKITNKKKVLVKKILQSFRNKNIGDEDDKSLWEKLQEQKLTEELNVYTLRNRERYFKYLIENFKKKHPNMLEHAIELERLKRSKHVRENLYSFLLEKGEEAKIKAATGTGGIRIVDPPNCPKEPNPRSTMRNLLLGALLGLGLGIGLAFFKDYLDNTIRTPDDINHFLKMPLMGIIPVIKSKSIISKKQFSRKSNERNGHSKNGRYTDSSILISGLRAKDPIVETYRGVRTNLQFAAVDHKIKSFVVTSSSPQEGKTLTSANLAIIFAEVGLNTVLVDTDLRKSKMHKLFKINKTPGLMECLVGEKSIHEVMYEVDIPNLKVIPSGKTPPNPAQVLASNKMNSFIKTLEHENDIVIFDTPPLIAVTDPVLLSSQVDGVLMVVRFEQTDINIARNALDILKKSRANIIGLVLNHAAFNKGYGYYHRYYKYYNYYYDETVRN